MIRDDVHGAETPLGTALEENEADPGSRLSQTIDVLDQWGHFQFLTNTKCALTFECWLRN